MALDLPKLRKLVAMEETDALSRFALGKKLFETYQSDASPEGRSALTEAADHLAFANASDPSHLATYHIRAQALINLDRADEARRVLRQGIDRVAGIGEGMGRDLGPAMQKLLDGL